MFLFTKSEIIRLPAEMEMFHSTTLNDRIQLSQFVGFYRLLGLKYSIQDVRTRYYTSSLSMYWQYLLPSATGPVGSCQYPGQPINSKFQFIYEPYINTILINYCTIYSYNYTSHMYSIHCIQFEVLYICPMYSIMYNLIKLISKVSCIVHIS